MCLAVVVVLDRLAPVVAERRAAGAGPYDQGAQVQEVGLAAVVEFAAGVGAQPGASKVDGVQAAIGSPRTARRVPGKEPALGLCGKPFVLWSRSASSPVTCTGP